MHLDKSRKFSGSKFFLTWTIKTKLCQLWVVVNVDGQYDMFICLNRIDPFHKWLQIINSFVTIKISLTNHILEVIIQKNCYSQTSLERLI